MNTPISLLNIAITGSMIRSILPIIIICIVSIFIVRHNFKFMNKLNKLVPVLYNDPKQFIAEVEEMLAGKVPKTFQPMLVMNVAVGHMELNDYATALKTMDRLEGVRMNKQSKYEYRMNLAHIYVHLGENEKAMDLIMNDLQNLKKMPMGGNLPRLNAFLRAFVAMEESDWVYAQEILDHVKKTFPTRMAGVDFNILYKRMNDCLKKADKMAKA